MKRNKRRHIAPQFEFGFAPGTFNLFQESTLDGEQLSLEREEADRARRTAEAAQTPLFPQPKPTAKP